MKVRCPCGDSEVTIFPGRFSNHDQVFQVQFLVCSAHVCRFMRTRLPPPYILLVLFLRVRERKRKRERASQRERGRERGRGRERARESERERERARARERARERERKRERQRERETMSIPTQIERLSSMPRERDLH